MKKIVVNGAPCTIEAFSGRVPRPGDVVGQRFGRRVYRVLCADGSDLILRNVRKPSLLEAVPREEVISEYGLVRMG